MLAVYIGWMSGLINQLIETRWLNQYLDWFQKGSCIYRTTIYICAWVKYNFEDLKADKETTVSLQATRKIFYIFCVVLFV